MTTTAERLQAQALERNRQLQLDKAGSLVPGTAPGDLPTKDQLTVDGSGRVVENAPITRTNQLDRFITPENTLQNQRIGLDVREVDNTKIDQTFQAALAASKGGGGVGKSQGLEEILGAIKGDIGGDLNREDIVRRQFESQLPFLDEQFSEQSKALASRTSALGRTGGGFVDRDFAELDLRQIRGREGLLGQLTANAAEREISDRIGLFNASTGLLGVEASRDIAGGRQKIAARGQGLSALLGAAGLDLQGQQSGINTDFGRGEFLQREREFENRLSRQAVQDEQNRMVFQQQGFDSNPQNQLNQTSNRVGDVSDQFGNNAGQIGDSLQNQAESEAAQQNSATFGTQTSILPPRLQRPRSTLDLNPVTKRPSQFGDIRRG